MPDEHSDGADVVDQLRRKSQLYSVAATMLSGLLEEAEAFFQDLPGKVEIVVSETQFRLSLERQNKVWFFIIASLDQQSNEWSRHRVTTASLPLKAKAAQMLPKLYQRFVDHFDSTQESL